MTVRQVDLTDEASVAALADDLGAVDHVVSTASARARGKVAELSPEAIVLSFRTKVVGPIMPAKHFAPRMPRDGSSVLFSGVAALEPDPGFLAVAATNGAVDTVTRSLAVELAPIRVNAVSPAPSTPAPGTRWATSGRTRCSPGCPTPIPCGASEPPRTSPRRRSSR